MVQRQQAIAEDETRAGTRRPSYAESMTEDEFTRWFLELCQLTGWSYRYHTHDSRKSDKGWPDWVLGRPSTGEIMFVELKGWRGRATRDQKKWLGFLESVGLETHLWYPADRDVIEARLRRPR